MFTSNSPVNFNSPQGSLKQFQCTEHKNVGQS